MRLAADAAMVGLTLGMVTLMGVGVARGARRSGREASSAMRLGLAVISGLMLWLGATALLASTGVLSDWSALPPRWPLLPPSAILALLVLGQTPFAKTLLANTPRHWPIAAQSFRIGVEFIIFAWHQDGRAPTQITFEGRNFDILVGLTAPLVAWLVATNRVTPKFALRWNVLGLAVLANTIATVATSAPGPLHLDWPGEPFTAIATWPAIWLPALLAPLAVFLHVASIRQNRSVSG
ncbi:hypothetical protein OV208_01600 [Corallococcus sp. bb12-1]|uniref:hypothetical protein n=1 Tax=Corallococcus sp. bb12-1 TaxID=2996784 RepID=UPI00226F2396|nr:hypothetical protein [Corallococcus sp. bb12-1]MCY1039997.1 hypothetical protein [Corallococcus sp. bb12-1]